MKITIVSIILIFLVHHILLFFKTNLTVPKLKDLVHAPTQKYEMMFNTINSMNSMSSMSSMNNLNHLANDQIAELEQSLNTVEGTYIKHLGNENTQKPIDMKNELKQFMKKQFKGSGPAVSMENANLSGSSSIQYSNY